MQAALKPSLMYNVGRFSLSFWLFCPQQALYLVLLLHFLLSLFYRYFLTMMTARSTLTVIFYALMALLLAVMGFCLLAMPDTILSNLHHNESLIAQNIWPHQVGISLLLAAALNLFCLYDDGVRRGLHLLLLFYTAGMAAAHGFTSASLWWLWVPAALYALAAILSVVRLPTKSFSDGDEYEGEIKWFNPKKGFGFIITADSSEYFVHFQALKNGHRHSLKQGTRVVFNLRPTDKGDQATNVYIV